MSMLSAKLSSVIITCKELVILILLKLLQFFSREQLNWFLHNIPYHVCVKLQEKNHIGHLITNNEYN